MIKQWAQYLKLHGVLLKDKYLSQDRNLFSQHAAQFYGLEGEILNHEKLYDFSGMTLDKRLRVYYQLIPKGFSGMLVDIGCAEAQLSDAFPNANYLGVDASQPNLKESASKRRKNQYVCGNAVELPLKNDSADILVCLNMLEHLFEPKDALEEFSRVVKGNGYCMVSVPNIIGELGSAGHVVFWKRRTWENLFRDYFTIEDYKKQDLIGHIFKEHVYKLKALK
jgi:2-polyprenyl-3-methyl-5-hydroxy-6-metoxy-1,4-benzoquinol methylase